MALVSNPKPGDDVSNRQAIAKLGSSKLGPTSTPKFLGVTTTSLTISGLTTDSLVYPVSGLLTSLGVAADGKIPIGSTGTTPVLANITGTAKRVIVTNGAGTIGLSGPQDLDTVDSPTFGGMTIYGGALKVGGLNDGVFISWGGTGGVIIGLDPAQVGYNDLTLRAGADGTGIKIKTDGTFDIADKMTAGVFAAPISVSGYGIELHYSGDDAGVTGIRSRAQLVTTDTTATALGGLFQAANNDNINAGVLMGFMAEAIGKSTANASTITTMRGGLIGTEWGALDTVTNLKTLHIRGHSLNAAGAGSFGTGYGLYIENEAVGGNGQAYDAGIYFKGTNLSAGNKAYGYGIDFSGGTYSSEEIKLANGSVIGSDKVTLQPTTDSTTFFQINDKDGNSFLTGDTVNNLFTNDGFYDSDQTVNQYTYPTIDAQQLAAILQDGSAFTGTEYTMATKYIAVKFTASDDHTVGDFCLRIKESANITNANSPLSGYIYSDDGGSPDAIISYGIAVMFGTLTTSYQVLSFGGQENLTSGLDYWLVIKYTSTPVGGNIVLDSDVSANMGATSPDGTIWTGTNVRLYYKLRGRTSYGVYGSSTNEAGISGNSTNDYGVYGLSINNTGVYGTSINSRGVEGVSVSGYGVFGSSTNSYGVYGRSTASFGVYAASINNIGAYCQSTNSYAGLYEINPASTNTVAEVLRVRRKTSNTAQNNIGGAMDWYIEDSVGTAELTGRISNILTNATSAAETSAMSLWTRYNGSAIVESLRLTNKNLTLVDRIHSDADDGGATTLNFLREDGAGTPSTSATITGSHDGAGANDTDGKFVIATNLDGTGLIDNLMIQSTGDWVINKTAGVGIKVDLAAPTFGFADLLGDQFSKNTGGTKPTLVAYNGAVEAWQFSDGDEAFLTYHIPHDYVPGTDIHLHVHWSQNNAGATGGTVDFKYFAIYAKGHNQVSGSTFTSTPITDTFSSIDINDGDSGLLQYQQHFTEVTISAATATAALFDRDDFEPDGVIELTLEMDANNLTGTPSDPFIHYVDIHYQTTGIFGTKSRTPDFYV